MSLENHPNIHAVGLQVDIIKAIEERLRGEGAEVDKGDLISRVSYKLVRFVEIVEAYVDELVAEMKARK